eukprot:TRINITY_DN3106_c0_g1_i1.p1 TRINITY_DN3106_c0_g1~~TRINITY_DN3106_c0_g1_i1.p1  ORF type:complete len:219 (+),score=33.11 TRINITY_DN3106_c0_g1_i1:135-791(+)
MAATRAGPGMALLLPLAFALFWLPFARGFYLPGVAPRDFTQGDKVSVKVNKLTSTKTQLPYEFYSLEYCRPAQIVNSAENLGEVLRGDRIENSPYEFLMKNGKTCQVVCRIQSLSAKSDKAFKEKIEEDYKVNMILDNLPVAVASERSEAGMKHRSYDRGFPVGYKLMDESNTEKYFIFNHLAFTVQYHADEETSTARIVGFEVKHFRYVTLIFSVSN